MLTFDPFVLLPLFWRSSSSRRGRRAGYLLRGPLTNGVKEAAELALGKKVRAELLGTTGSASWAPRLVSLSC